MRTLILIVLLTVAGIDWSAEETSPVEQIQAAVANVPKVAGETWRFGPNVRDETMTTAEKRALEYDISPAVYKSLQEEKYMAVCLTMKIGSSKDFLVRWQSKTAALSKTDQKAATLAIHNAEGSDSHEVFKKAQSNGEQYTFQACYSKSEITLKMFWLDRQDPELLKQKEFNESQKAKKAAEQSQRDRATIKAADEQQAIDKSQARDAAKVETVAGMGWGAEGDIRTNLGYLAQRHWIEYIKNESIKSPNAAENLMAVRDGYLEGLYLNFPEDPAMIIEWHYCLLRDSKTITFEEFDFFEKCWSNSHKADIKNIANIDIAIVKPVHDSIKSARDNWLANDSGDKGEGLWQTEGPWKFQAIIKHTKAITSCCIHIKWADEKTTDAKTFIKFQKEVYAIQKNQQLQEDFKAKKAAEQSQRDRATIKAADEQQAIDKSQARDAAKVEADAKQAAMTAYYASLPVYVLKDGTKIKAVQVVTGEDAYTIKDTAGKFKTFKKTDVEDIIIPKN